MKNYYLELTREIIRGQRWICVSQTLESSAQLATKVLEYGGTALAVGARRGAGPIPDGLPTIDLGLDPAPTMMDGIRTCMAAVANLPAAAFDDFDPDREARAIRPLADSLSRIGGRPVFGPRPEAWGALEDKTRIDAVWDAIGLPRAPSQVVPLAWPEVWPVARSLDQGDGTAWVADNREGAHGGAEGLRWVRSEADGREAARELAKMADCIRIMPFMEGLPCSIHAFVFEGTVICLRPVEMIMLRQGASRRLHYARAGTFWEPGPAVEAEMREAARRVGAYLGEVYGYRGSFTLDGILTRRGFRPTELNSRYGGALGTLSKGIDGLWLHFINMAMVEGLDVDWRPADLETMLMEGSRAFRSGGGMANATRILEPCMLRLALEGEDWRVVGEEVKCDATVKVGPGPMGTEVLLDLDRERTPVGPSSAPRVASALRFLDRRLGLGLGPLTAAPEAVRDAR